MYLSSIFNPLLSASNTFKQKYFSFNYKYKVDFIEAGIFNGEMNENPGKRAFYFRLRYKC